MKTPILIATNNIITLILNSHDTCFTIELDEEEISRFKDEKEARENFFNYTEKYNLEVEKL